jgi:hypothetical protein
MTRHVRFILIIAVETNPTISLVDCIIFHCKKLTGLISICVRFLRATGEEKVCGWYWRMHGSEVTASVV